MFRTQKVAFDLIRVGDFCSTSSYSREWKWQCLICISCHYNHIHVYGCMLAHTNGIYYGIYIYEVIVRYLLQ